MNEQHRETVLQKPTTKYDKQGGSTYQLWEDHLLEFCGIAVAAYIGAFSRIGIGYYRIWSNETNYCVMYTQVAGCLIMGYYLYFKPVMHTAPKRSFDKIHYNIITAGLCGSITTFSTWSMECSKNFMLQWDQSWGNAHGSYNGGRFFEWIVSMWIGVALPIAALRVGYSIAKYRDSKSKRIFKYKLVPVHSVAEQIESGNSPENDAVVAVEGNEKKETKTVESPSSSSFSSSSSTTFFEKFVVIAAFVVSTILVISVPMTVDSTWKFITYTGVFGIAGAYLRYQVSGSLNSFNPDFPIGTFLVNIAGTYLLAILYLLSKFVVDYYDVELQAVLYGLSVGFCGCLTTVSAFVAELDALSEMSSYRYGIATNLVAQFGIMVIYSIYSYSTVKPTVVMQPYVNQCQMTQDLCQTLFTRLNCPAEYFVNSACGDMNDYRTYTGDCSCGDFAADRVIELMVDSQVKFNASNSFVAVWPTHADEILDPTQTIDYCLTHQNMCNQYLNRVQCPPELREINSCDRQGLYHTQSVCKCGPNDVPGGRIQELVTDALLARRYDLLPYNGYITLLPQTVNFCEAYEQTCDKMLDHVQCPKPRRVAAACSISGNYSTWNASCTCANYDITERIAEDLFDAIMRPNMQPLIVQPNKTEPIWEMCQSYHQICHRFLDFIGCAEDLRIVRTCGNVTDRYPFGQVQAYNGSCFCAEMKMLDDRIFETVIDNLLFENINTKYIYIAPPVAPFTLTESSNPYKQMLYPSHHIIPTQN